MLIRLKGGIRVPPKYAGKLGKVTDMNPYANSWAASMGQSWNNYTVIELVGEGRREFNGYGPAQYMVAQSQMDFEIVSQEEYDPATAEARKKLLQWNPFLPHKYWLSTEFGLGLAVGSVGSDPEVFVVDKENEVIPAFTFLPGKDDQKALLHYTEPLYGDLQYPKSKVYWDGFQAEIAPMASHCLGWHTDATRHCLYQMNEAAAKVGGKLTNQPTFFISEESMAQGTDEQVALGCMPSLNAYGMTAPLKAESGRELQLRSAGCHVHLGTTATHKLKAVEYVKAMDQFAGVTLTALLAGMEDPRRRLYYGMAGEYRLPAHGIEYRVPSSAVMGAPWLFNMCVDMVRGSVHAYQGGFFEQYKIAEEEAVHIINNLDVEAARGAIRRNLNVWCGIAQCIWPGLYAVVNMRRIVELVMKGVLHFVPDINDMHKWWRLADKKNYITHSGGPYGNVANFITEYMPNMAKNGNFTKGVLDEIL